MKSNPITSKFSYRILAPIWVTLPLAILLGFILKNILSTQTLPLIFAWLIPFLLYCGMLIRNELKNRTVKIEITESQITVSGYLGCGKKRHYNLYAVSEIKLCEFWGNSRKYEYIFLSQNGKRIITISEFYHSNFHSLKQALLDSTGRMEKIELSFLDEVKLAFNVLK